MATALQILGALGIFLFGMKVMSEGVQKFAGGKMRAALASITGNRFKGILTGVFTTGLVQSSSATTVLVVSFVNVGLLTLVESISVIMGANLGTTVTAWIVAAVGTKVKLTALAIPIIGLGFPVYFLAKGKLKSFGEFVVGFGILFLGLYFLKDAVPDLKSGIAKEEDQDAINTIRYWIETIGNKGYFSYVLFMIGGIILTLIVQSSSAAMAITITCAMNGWFSEDPYESFRISAAVVLGENIGTTVTAWLASLGASTEAKRAARAHFLFNVIGTTWMLIVFVGFTAIVWKVAAMLPDSIREIDEKFQSNEVAFATAIFHTSFNLINIGVLVWFVPQIARLVQKWVPSNDEDDGDKKRLRYISQKFVDLGELNVVEAEGAIRKMSAHAQEMFAGFRSAFENPATDIGAEITRLKKMEDEADLMMQDITEYLIQCSARDLTPDHAGNIAAMIRIVGELEESTDCTYRLVKLIERKYNKGHEFTEHQTKRVNEIADVVAQAFSAVDNFLLQKVPADVISAVKSLEVQTDNMRKRYNKEAVMRMAEGDIRIEMLYTDINNQLEAMANHALNIMEASDSASLERE